MFGSTSVKRVTKEGSEWLNLTLPDLDPRFEDPELDIDPNVRTNFLPISQLNRAQVQPLAFAKRNSTLVASNTNGAISTVIAGETITYMPKSGDTRLGKLDRHGKYTGEYEGEIKKSLKRQYKEVVKERDRQILQATAEYRALAAMSAEERADLLERLWKPYEWQGAFDEDQHDEPYIPEVYTRDISMDSVLTWMEDDFLRVSITSRLDTAPSASRSILGSVKTPSTAMLLLVTSVVWATLLPALRLFLLQRSHQELNSTSEMHFTIAESEAPAGLRLNVPL